MYIPIWQRYLFKEFLFSIIFILFGIYALYITIDLMSHIKNVYSSNRSFESWVAYYQAMFLKRLDILLPFSILIATVRTLFRLQERGELVGLLTGGLSKKKLLTPFLYISIAGTLLIYANYELFLPSALTKIKTLQEESESKSKDDETEEISSLGEMLLKDSSKFIYSRYDSLTKEFHNVFWIRSINEIFYIKRLSILGKIPEGKWIDKIARNKDGILEKVAAIETHSFQDMNFDQETLTISTTSPNEHSISQLVKQIVIYRSSSSQRAIENIANFVNKITFPWLCLIAFLAPAPFCMRISRNLSLLVTYLLAISGLFSLNLILQTAFTISKSHFFSPWIIIFIPWIAVFGYFGKKYYKILKE